MGGMGSLSDASVVPLSTIEPTAAPDDLEPLARLIGDRVRVVAIGESAHGAHEFYALRLRLVRFLVERMNFTALLWESGFPEGFLVDDYIQGGGQDRERVQVDGMTMHMGRCQEMGDLLDWLRAHNESKRGDSKTGASTTGASNTGPSRSGPVRFYGMDLPGPGATWGSALDVVVPYVESVDPGFHPRLARLRELAESFGPGAPSNDSSGATPKVVLPGTAALFRYIALPVADRNELTCLLAELSARFDALRRLYIERSDAARYDVVRQLLRAAAQLDVQLRAVATLMAGDKAACEANVRDLAMADTVQWVLGREERVVVLAHNGHIQRTPVATYAGSIDTLGVHLAGQLGDRYLTIGTTCGGGEIIATRSSSVEGSQETELIVRDLPPVQADAIDSVLDSSLAGTSLLDLRTLGAQSAAAIDAARRMRMQDQIVEIDVRRAFDMLIHVPRISLWTSTLNAALPDLREGKSVGG